MVAPRLAEAMGPARVVTLGLWIACAGFAILAAAVPMHSIGWLVAGFTIYALGLAPVFTLATDIIVGCALPERAGAASANLRDELRTGRRCWHCPARQHRRGGVPERIVPISPFRMSRPWRWKRRGARWEARCRLQALSEALPVMRSPMLRAMPSSMGCALPRSPAWCWSARSPGSRQARCAASIVAGGTAARRAPVE